MSQPIIRNDDFKSGATFSNIRGIIYKGSGTPVNRVNSANAGAIYIDNLTGQLWLATTSGEPAIWRPYFADISTSITIDSDVQEGDLVGIFGLGSWSTSGSLNTVRAFPSGAGSQNANFLAGGWTSAGVATNVSELFNGTTWFASGTLNVVRFQAAAAGSQNAGLVTGGATDGGNNNVTELFNGASWSTSGTLNAIKSQCVGIGTQNAGLMTGGVTASVSGATELFNGATWSVGNNLTAREGPAGAGSQNAALAVGGITSVATNLTELFNGSSWSASAPSSVAKSYMAGAGMQNAALIAGGDTNLGSTFSRISELFNGSAWSASGVLSIKRSKASGAGMQNAGLIVGGETSNTILTNRTELHNQTIYRKLTYSSMQCANNIGIAYNSSATSLTASVMRGDVSGYYVPGNTWFGISRFNNNENTVYVSSATATISSISSTITNQAVLNLSASLTTGFAIGGLLLISNGLKVPIIGGNVTNPVVRWENVSTSASTSLTVGCVWGQRITFDLMNIASSGTTATVTQTATQQLTPLYKGRIGDTLVIPYSNISGTNGSFNFYGTYLINGITNPSTDVIAYTITLPQSLGGISENNIGQITVLQQAVCSLTSFSAESIILGYRNKMRNPMNPISDDLSNGLM